MQNIASVIGDLLNVKKGYKTSEFYVALAPAVVAILNVLGVHVSNSATTHLLVVVTGAVATVYVAVRTYLKSVHLGHVASLAGLAHQLEAEGVQAVKVLESAQPLNLDQSPVNATKTT